MSMVTYPLNNIEYTAEDAELFHATRTSGIYAKNSFQYSISGANNVITIGSGMGWIKNKEFAGKVIAQKEAVSIDMGIADPVYPRIDSIVIQFSANSNETNIVVKKGVASTNPIAPAVVRDESIYELHLYQVLRKAGELTISANDITDLRSDENYCGLMAESITSLESIGAAPDGYGLGGDSTWVTNLDNVKNNGFYAWTTNADGTLANGSPFSYGNLLVLRRGERVIQVGFDPSMHKHHGIVIRYSDESGTWTAWAWLNPPMSDGVEYKTFETRGLTPVYTKMINFGALPNAGSKTVSTGVEANKIIRSESNIILASGTTTVSPYFTTDGQMTMKHLFSGTLVQVITTQDYSGGSGKFQIWYTKD